ncbi:MULTISPECIES: hypothetical protein [Trinickia]|uniref:hypothetical protein n=1 Tax=Trinickia TaxID=2571160 RepID=UPI002158F4E4|nr:hypothetical protein [Trinickia symbiotica]
MLDVTVLVTASGRVRRRLHAVMGEQCSIVLRELVHSFAIEVAYGRGQIVGAVPFGNTADLPQARFKPFGQRLEALGKANAYDLHVRIGQHEMIDQAWECRAPDRYSQAIHRSEIGLSHAPGHMLLWKHDLLFRAVTNSPRLNVSLQRTQLAFLISPRKRLAQQREQRLGLKCRVSL